MAPYHNPIVLVTRPEDSAHRFVAALRAESGPFDAVIAPAFGFEDLPHQMPPFEQAIFTSKAGVASAPDGAGRVAWCVGDVTAQAALRKGYHARSAHGDANALVEMILARGQGPSLAHIRGETSHGNVKERLTAAGLNCVEAITYRKSRRAAPDSLGDVLRTGRPVIVPLFSAETVSICAEWDVPFSQAHIVAISHNVADAARMMQPIAMTVAKEPDLPSMTQAVAGLIA